MPVDLSANSPVREAFSLAIHERDVNAVKSYWQRQIFSGRGVPPPEKASDSEVLAFVRANPGAVGYVSSGTAVGSGVKVLEVTGPVTTVGSPRISSDSSTGGEAVLSRLKFSHKIFLMPALAAAGIIVIFVVVQLSAAHTEGLVERIDNGYIPKLELSRDLVETLAQIQRGLQDAVSAADPGILAETDEPQYLLSRPTRQRAQQPDHRTAEARTTRADSFSRLLRTGPRHDPKADRPGDR